jgi:nucleoside-diphosphate-sugar epimerase
MHRVGVVTGAGGFVGAHVVAALIAAGMDVRGTWRTRRPAVAAGMTAVRADLTDRRVLADLLQGADVLVHLAARAHITRETAADPDAAFDAENVQLTANLAAAAQEAGVRRFVFLSTVGVHGDVTRPGHALTEADPPAPVTAYARSKWRAEEALQEGGCKRPAELVIIRAPLVYGVGAPGNLERLLAAIDRRLPLPFGNVRNSRSLVGVKPLADLLALAASHPHAAGQVFLAADERRVSTRAIIKALAAGRGRAPVLVPVPVGVLRIGACLLGRMTIHNSLCESFVVDAGRARELLGWRSAADTVVALREMAAASAAARS